MAARQGLKDADRHDDKINPKHYASLGKYSAIHIIRAWNAHRRVTGGKDVTFNVGNALKYIQRAGSKPGEDEVVDLKKAVWYLQNEVHDLDPDATDPAA